MEDAKTALARIDEWRKALKEASLGGAQPDAAEVEVQFRKLVDLIDEHLINDLNINGVLGQLFQIIRTTNGAIASRQISPAAVFATLKFWDVLDTILGLGDVTVSIPPEVQKLLDDRSAARKGKDFAKSDELRKAIEALGWKVKDTAKGQEVTKS
jgi:cysteinyl-tRNA synthetase